MVSIKRLVPLDALSLFGYIGKHVSRYARFQMHAAT